MQGIGTRDDWIPLQSTNKSKDRCQSTTAGYQRSMKGRILFTETQVNPKIAGSVILQGEGGKTAGNTSVLSLGFLGFPATAYCRSTLSGHDSCDDSVEWVQHGQQQNF